jgi:hypothetical protein
LRRMHFGRRLLRRESAAEFGPHAHHFHFERSIARFLGRQFYRRDVSRPRSRRWLDRRRWSRSWSTIARDCIEGRDRCRPIDACTSHTKPSAGRLNAHAGGQLIVHRSAAVPNSAKTSPPQHFADDGRRRSSDEHGGAHIVVRVDAKNADDSDGHSADDDGRYASNDDAKFAPQHHLRTRKERQPRQKI